MHCLELDDKYEIINTLGSTKHSKIYLVRHRKLQILRVAKVVQRSSNNGQVVDRLLKEANLIKNFKHKAIPIIYDIEEFKDSICIIEEFIVGKSLAEFVLDSSINNESIFDIAEQLCNILGYIHREENSAILHLDLKPENIMITEEKEVKLLDFDNGIHNGEYRSEATGSPFFAAPEQYSPGNLSCRADIYSLGMIIWYMADEGHIQESIEKIRHSIFIPIIKKCTHHTESMRYDSVMMLHNDLRILKKNIDKDVEEPSKIIYLAGSRHGIGVTHICMSIAHFLRKKGIKAVCVDWSENQHIWELVRDLNLTKNGTYQYDELQIMPEYQDSFKCDYSGYKVLIVDCGTKTELFNRTIPIDSLTSSFHFLVVGGSYGMESEQRLVSSEKKLDGIFINLVDGVKFYELVKRKYGRSRCYRIPCVYDSKNGNSLLDEVFEEILIHMGITVYEREKRGKRIISKLKNIWTSK